MLGIARGSLAEVETFLILSERLGLIQSGSGDTLLEDCAEINRMLNGLVSSVSNRQQGRNNRGQGERQGSGVRRQSSG